MTSIEAYVLAKKLIAGATTGISNITFNEASSQIIFHMKDGSQLGMYIPVPKDGVDGASAYDIAVSNGFTGTETEWLNSLKGSDGEDGVSVTDITIDENNHLMCILSDNTQIDAGEILIPTSGGGLVQSPDLASLPYPGSEDTLYITTDDDILYYWDNKDKLYRAVTGGSGTAGIDFRVKEIIFDGASHTYNLPIDNKKVSIYINGLYLTEGIDYSINREVSPNTVVFETLWESSDICSVVWVRGSIAETQPSGDVEVGIPQLKQDIKEILGADGYLRESDIPRPWPISIPIDNIYAFNDELLTTDQKALVKVIYIINDDNKITGIGYARSGQIYLTKINNGESITVSFATKKDIDKLFEDTPLISLATEQDIDNMFKEVENNAN